MTMFLSEIHPSHFRRGLLFLFLSAASFSMSLIMANLALRTGTTPLTIGVARYVIAAALMFLFLKLTGREIRVRGPWMPIIILGFLVLGLTLTYVGSVQYIPVSLAVLIFYTNPFLVVGITRILDKTPLTPVHLGTMVLAFIGLGMALEIWNAMNLDWRGVGLAALASVTLASIYIVSGRAMRETDSQTLSFHALTAAAIFATLITLLTGGPVWPEPSSGLFNGWVWLLLTGIFYSLGQSFIFAGIARTGPVPSSLIMNLEPIFTIGFAVVLLGDQLSPVQTVGAALVIGAVFLVSHQNRQKPDPADQGDPIRLDE